jgi:hypothetical protein
MFGAGPGSRAGRGRHGYNVVYSDTSGNVIGGNGAGANLGLASQAVTLDGQNGQCIALGAYAGSILAAGDFGCTFAGAYSGFLNRPGTVGYDTCIGHGAGGNLVAFFNGTTTTTTYSGCTALGRSAGAGWTSDIYCVSVGHASMFKGGGNAGVVALGDAAGGAAVDGSATNWQGTGLTYWGAINDTNVSYIGRMTGKASATARSNCFALGALAQVPAADNVGVLGHGLTAVVTKGAILDATAKVTDSSGAGTAHTLAAATIFAKLVSRTGSAASTITDTTDTAANIVALVGNGCETPVGFMFSVINSTGQQINLAGGTGVTIAGFSGMTNGSISIWYLLITNSTAGAEAVTIQRGGT